MADKVIQVNVTSTKSQRVSVSPGNVKNEISATPDSSQYYSNLAKNWAIGAGLILNEDYSSKHYANESAKSANSAKNYADSAQSTFENIQQVSDIILTDIEEAKVDAIDNIATVKDESIASVEAKTNEVLSTVNTGIAEINSTKTTILQDIEFVADGEKQEIEDLIDNGKEELKESIGDVKVLTTLEIGDIGFTQMAIDETKGKRRILNGQLIIQEQYVQFTNIIKNSVALNPDLACTESEWQTAVTMSKNGVCEKFVIDDEASTIRLPKYPQYLDLSINTGAVSQTVSIYGNGKVLGFWDGSSSYYGLLGLYGSAYGGFDKRAYNVQLPNGSFTSNIQKPASGTALGLTSDANASGITGSVTIPAVQSEKIKGTYFIQVATGAETEDNIINEIELNNPFSLLDYKYSEYELNNLSWLRSNGQWNAKAVYPAVYDLLLKIYNGTETKAGVSVKLHTDTSATEYDFRINTAEETFMLPTKVQNTPMGGTAPVVGNGITIGLTNGTTNVGLYNPSVSGARLAISSTAYGMDVGNTTPNVTSDYGTLGLTTDPTKSGLVADLSKATNSNLHLYFYVGETVQNANLINAGRIEEKVASLIPDNSSLISSYGMPSNKYIDLTLGASGTTYTAPANGWVNWNGTFSAAAGILRISAQTTGMGTSVSGGSAYSTPNRTFLPVLKGEVFNITHTNIKETYHFRFFYAGGEV